MSFIKIGDSVMIKLYFMYIYVTKGSGSFISLSLYFEGIHILNSYRSISKIGQFASTFNNISLTILKPETEKFNIL